MVVVLVVEAVSPKASFQLRVQVVVAVVASAAVSRVINLPSARKLRNVTSLALLRNDLRIVVQVVLLVVLQLRRLDSARATLRLLESVLIPAPSLLVVTSVVVVPVVLVVLLAEAARSLGAGLHSVVRQWLRFLSSRKLRWRQCQLSRSTPVLTALLSWTVPRASRLSWIVERTAATLASGWHLDFCLVQARL